MTTEFHVQSAGVGFTFPAEHLRYFIAANAFGSRLATALQFMTHGEAIAIRAARQTIIVSHSANGIATVRRRFKLARDIL